MDRELGKKLDHIIGLLEVLVRDAGKPQELPRGPEKKPYLGITEALPERDMSG